MVDYSPAEHCLRRMIMARNLLDILTGIRLEGGRDFSFVLHYGILHLVQLMDACEGLMGHLTLDQRRLVACLSDLICGIVDHRDALRKTRNGWVAHLQDRDMSAEAASDFVRRVGLPDDPMWYSEMFECAIIFADAVQSLLPEIVASASRKVDHTADVGPAQYVFDPEQVIQNVLARLERARAKAEKQYPDRPWTSLLSLADDRRERLEEDAF